jgi:hypothetical protein
MYLNMKSGDAVSFYWDEVFHVWKQFAGFLILFLIHNFFLAPILVYRQQIKKYILWVVMLIGLFSVSQCITRPDDIGQRREEIEGHRPPHELREQREPPRHLDRPRHHHRPPHPLMLDWHDVFSIIMLILMLGMNLGIKLYFKNRNDQLRMAKLEKENLEQQLEYLKYQINPHFFMNTLNNIHALVDIDPEKAKDTILELSKMMRFVLYEGDKKGVPLNREFEFIRNYVTLMRLRYTDKVDVQVNLPAEVPDYQLPPLMLITFIENAFKHGISYQHDSFVHVKIEVRDERKEVRGIWLCFHCRNSKAEKPNEEQGGVGLANVRQRLNLLYGENYTLNIQDEPDTYNVELQIPLT